ncbi:MAG: tRNA guanosine(34) transglycosylase Tgt [Thermodesulfobacteriota bacterium]
MQIREFRIQDQDKSARTGILCTNHGQVQTPVFMPVGTVGCVKSLTPRELSDLGFEIILGNTYHLYLRPGDEIIARLNGLHEFSSWNGAVLTDSGGFQVFSLASLRELNSQGVEFRSHIDGSKHFFSPERVIRIQKNLGSDIMMVLDECVPYSADYSYTQRSLQLTTSWAKRSREAHPENSSSNLLFGIVQGGFYKDLRTQSAEEICSIPFDGYALGGVSVGEPKEVMREIVSHTVPLLPQAKPRYLMGVGTPLDILESISLGVDMFDCVLPTRNARNGTLYTSRGKMNIKKAAYREDPGAVDPACSCYTCKNFSRAYLRHLYMARELLSYRLNTIHNLAFYQKIIGEAREAIQNKRLQELKESYASVYSE